MLRIGVTGHRTFDRPSEVRAEIVARCRELAARSPDGRFELWSSLADGADRLVADVAADVLRAAVVAVLPLPPADYRTDFDDESSLEFDRMLRAATDVVVTGSDATGSRAAAYLRAGRAVVEAVDVMIALWDGTPARGEGGTAQIVELALAAGVEVVVVPVTRAPVRP